MANRSHLVYFLLVIAIFLGIYSYFGAQRSVPSYNVETDFVGSYGLDAQNILHGKMVQEQDHGPVYAIAVAFLTVFVGDVFHAGVVLSILSAILLGIGLYLILKNLYNFRIALFSMLLLDIVLLPYSFVVGLDIFFAMLFTFSIYFFIRRFDFNTRDLVLAGTFASLAFLVRYISVILPIAAFIILFFASDGFSIGEKIKKYIVFLIPIGVLMIPWYFISRTIHPEFSAPGLSAAMAWDFYGPGTPFGGDERRLIDPRFYSVTSVVFYDFKHFVFHYLHNIVDRFQSFSLLGLKFPAYYFLVPGIILAFLKSTKKQVVLFLYPVIGFLILCLVNYINRYYLFLFPFAVFWIVFFFFMDWDVKSPLSDLFSYKNIAIVLYLLTALFLFKTSYSESRVIIQREPRELLQVAHFLQGISRKGDRVIERKPNLAFLAGLKDEFFPRVDSIDKLLDYAKKRKARFILYGPIEAKKRPQLKELYKTNFSYPGIKRIYIVNHPKLILYEILSY
ncbi:MAG: glycosyltransferase family 39 protein [Calditrichaeota bacterium]|nr:glycosyltransferase family 39 protein [Calditrichota bacterium]